MNKIKETFEQYGYTFNQIDRKDNIAIFSASNNNVIKYYEVVIISVNKKDEFINGRLIKKAGDESYPTNSLWGIKGFTYLSYDKAMEKYNELAH